MILRVIAWAGKAIATVIIVSILAIWTTGYIITSYVESILKQYEIPIEIPPVAMSGIWGKLWGSEIASQYNEKDSKSITELQGSTNNLDSTGELFSESNEKDTAEDSAVFDDAAKDVMAPIDIDNQDIAMTTDELIDSKASMSIEDKDRMLEILMTKLPPDALQTFFNYFEDGLTDQELIDIQQIMAQNLNKEEYEELMIILKKY